MNKLIKPENPYKKGSFAYQQANCFYSGKLHMSIDQLITQAAWLRERSNDFCGHSIHQMEDFRFEAQCIEEVITANGGSIDEWITT